MLENMQKAQINHMMKFTRKDKKDFKRILRNQINQQRFNQRDYTYKYNNLEIYVTVYPGKHPTIELTTDYFPHTFSSDPDDIRYNMNRGKSIQFWLPNGKTKTSNPSNLKLLYHANHWKIDIIEHQ